MSLVTPPIGDMDDVESIERVPIEEEPDLRAALDRFSVRYEIEWKEP